MDQGRALVRCMDTGEHASLLGVVTNSLPTSLSLDYTHTALTFYIKSQMLYDTFCHPHIWLRLAYSTFASCCSTVSALVYGSHTIVVKVNVIIPAVLPLLVSHSNLRPEFSHMASSDQQPSSHGCSTRATIPVLVENIYNVRREYSSSLDS